MSRQPYQRADGPSLLVMVFVFGCGHAGAVPGEPAPEAVAVPHGGGSATGQHDVDPAPPLPDDAGEVAAGVSGPPPLPPDPCEWVVAKDQLSGPGREPVDADRWHAVDVARAPPADLVADLGNCGNWGHCEFVVLLGCGTGTYRPTWGPDYAQYLEVIEADGHGWARLEAGDRTGVAGCDVPLTVEWRRTDDRWDPGEPCAPAEGGVWDDACGERPPACRGEARGNPELPNPPEP